MRTDAGTRPPTEIIGSAGGLGVRRWRAQEPWAAVVLAHPEVGDSEADALTAARLSAEGIAVISAGYPGRHRPGAPTSTTSLSSLVDDLGAVVDLARGEHPDLPLVLIGHSLGGILAMHVAEGRSQDLDALVLSGSAIATRSASDSPAAQATRSRRSGRRAATARLTDGPSREPRADERGRGSRRRSERALGCPPPREDAPALGPLPTLWLLGPGGTPGDAPGIAPADPITEIIVFLRRAISWERMLR